MESHNEFSIQSSIISYGANITMLKMDCAQSEKYDGKQTRKLGIKGINPAPRVL